MAGSAYQTYQSQSVGFSGAGQANGTAQSLNHIRSNMCTGPNGLGKRHREDDDVQAQDAPSAKRFQYYCN